MIAVPNDGNRAACWLVVAASFVLVMCGERSHSARHTAERDSTWIEVRGATLVGFVPANTAATLDPDTREALDDFAYHLGTAEDSLRKLGFRIAVVGGRRFYLVRDTQIDTFSVPKDSADIGYYLVAPGRLPTVYYGVQTNSDLIESVRQYVAGRTVP